MQNRLKNALDFEKLTLLFSSQMVPTVLYVSPPKSEFFILGWVTFGPLFLIFLDPPLGTTVLHYSSSQSLALSEQLVIITF